MTVPPRATTTSATEPPAPGEKRLSEADNGRTVTIARGTTVLLQLSNTYWTIAPPAPASVLAQEGSTATVPAPISQCVPGAGCGTITATFRAVGVGTAHVSASRSSCGEALLCTGSAGMYSVTVVVSA